MSIRRRFATIVLTAVAVLTIAPPAMASAATSKASASQADERSAITIAQAERKMVRLINQMRVADGKIRMQAHPGLMDIARKRSKVNAAIHDMHHDLDMVIREMATDHIQWSRVGEALAYTFEVPLAESASEAANLWRNSHDHKALLVDRRHNYLGVGLAIDGSTGRRHWTALVIEGEDVTAPIVAMTGPLATSPASSDTVVAWSGYDIPLSVHTAGLATMDVARSVDGGAWSVLLRRTTAREHTWTLTPGRTYAFRVRARDRAGNLSAWSPALLVHT